MTSYVEVAVNVPQVSGVFDYHLPAELEGLLQPGHLVEVPFGHQTVQGVVLRSLVSPSVSETRPVLALIDENTVLTPYQIALAQKLAKMTLSPLSACIGLMLPAGLDQQADTLYRLVDVTRLPKGASNALQRRLVSLLQQRGALRGRQIDQHMPRLDWRMVARKLVRLGALTAQAVLPPPTIHPKQGRTVQLAVSPEDAHQAMESLGRQGTPALTRRQAIMQYLVDEAVPVEAAWVYATSGGSLADLQYLAKKGLVILAEAETFRDPLAGLVFAPDHPLELTRDQQAAWKLIKNEVKAAAQGKDSLPFLIHGVTGSGKTEIYLQATAETLRLGRQVIVLVPEIAMTPQIVHRFSARFPGQVGLVHYRLSEGENYDTWRRARLGQLSIIVGPRSALFTPLPDPGLIVVDECHDDSYYNADQQPFYHARRAAVEYARICHAICLLGSATPDLDTRYLADQGHYHYIELPRRILAHRQAVAQQLEQAGQRQSPRFRPLSHEAEAADLPAVDIVDMRLELQAGNRSVFSRLLQKALRQTLDAGQQAILFLNRRGSATYVFCRTCGFSLRCPRCDTPLTFHTSLGQPPLPSLLCHRCGYSRKMPETCPNCRSTQIRQFGLGTERVEDEMRRLFPDAHLLRWDFETTRQKGAHEIILSHFSNHQADVLIGTQMVAKGLDLPLVTLVGAILADVGLNLPDLRANERVFNLLTQVAGRAGRSPLGGQVVVQSFQPEHYVIQTAARHDYAAFYRQELASRRKLDYPPFTQLVRLEIRDSDPVKVEKAARQMAAQVQSWLDSEHRPQTQIIGPAPCFFARINGLYRWQVIIFGPDPASLFSGRLLPGWRIEVNPPSLL
jgi:primosomal protein N' (replication factor Y)